MQYLRYTKLLLYGAEPRYENPFNPSSDVILPTQAETDAIDLSNLRIVFKYTCASWDSPDHCFIKVYNMNPATFKKAQEFAMAVLEVGYKEEESKPATNASILIRGQIIQARYYRENNVDTVHEFLVVDNDEYHNYAFLNGNDKNKAYRDLIKQQMETTGLEVQIEEGTEFPENKTTRGQSWFMPTRYAVQRIRENTSTDTTVSGNTITFMNQNAASRKEAIVLNRLTGLIERPKQTFNGIEVKCLINPKIKINSTVQIQEQNIDDIQWEATYGYTDLFQKYDKDGFYRVMHFTAEGDNRGTNWYMYLHCAGINDPLSPKGTIPDQGWTIQGVIM